MSVWEIIIAIALLVSGVALVVVVMLQSNRGSEMTALTGGSRGGNGRGQSAKKEMFMKRLTIVLGIVFFVLAVVMGIVTTALK